MTAVTLDVMPPRTGGRVRPLAAVQQTLTLAWRNLVQIKHNPMELMDLSIQPVMFVLLFTYVFGGQMSGSPEKYLQYALPGIIVQNALFATMNTAMGLNVDLTKGVLDRLRSMPIARWAPLLGRVVADAGKQLWSVVLMVSLGLVMGYRVHGGILGALGGTALLLVFALATSWMSVLIGMLVDEPEKVMTFGFTLVFPLTFTSSAFARADTMPGWLRAWADVNPVTRLTDAVRGLFAGTDVTTPVLWSLGWAALIAAVFFPLAVRAYRRHT